MTDRTWDGLLKFGTPPPERVGIDLGGGVRLGPEHRHRDSNGITSDTRRIYRGDADIGGVDYECCAACRWVLVGEISLIEAEHRRGIGRRVLAQLRTELPGYRWFISPEKSGSRPFWDHLRAVYPGEYLTAAMYTYPCPHWRDD